MMESLTIGLLQAFGHHLAIAASWFAAMAQQLYLQKDKLRVVWALGTGKTNFQYFETISDTAGDVYIDYNITIDFFTSSAVYEVYDKMYAGIQYTQSNSTTTFE